MNDATSAALAEQFGARFSKDTRVVRPSSEGELCALLSVMRERSLRAGPDLTIDRSLFDSVLRINAKSGILEVGAGLTLDAVERVAQGHGLTLGALSPGARRLAVGAFLEGPYAGLRAVPGGRLEPVAMSVRAVLSNGQVFRSPSAPRSAAGPGLEFLFLGGRARLGLIVSAELRLLPLSERTEYVTLAFPSIGALIEATRMALDDGAAIAEAQLYRRGADSVLHARFSGSDAATVKDANSLARRGAAQKGLLIDADLPVWAAQDERELSWSEVQASLAEGQPLRLHRLAVEAVVAELPAARPASPALAGVGLWDRVASAADPDALLTGEA